MRNRHEEFLGGGNGSASDGDALAESPLSAAGPCRRADPAAARERCVLLHPQADRLSREGDAVVSNPVYAPNATTVFTSAVNGFDDFSAPSTTSNPVDLSAATDVPLAVTVPPETLTGTNPSLIVQLDGVDPAGNTIS